MAEMCKYCGESYAYLPPICWKCHNFTGAKPIVFLTPEHLQALDKIRELRDAVHNLNMMAQELNGDLQSERALRLSVELAMEEGNIHLDCLRAELDAANAKLASAAERVRGLKNRRLDLVMEWNLAIEAAAREVERG